MKLFVVLAIFGAFGVGYYLTSSGKGTDLGSGVITSVPAATFSERVQAGDSMLIDIRTADEFASGTIPGSINVDFYDTAGFNTYLDSLDKDASYLIYCRSGSRSSKALTMMKRKGFAKVTDLSGGIIAWQQAGLPLSQ